MANTFSGKVWKFGHDINTDLVIPNFAVLMSVDEQLQHCFGANRPGWVDEVRTGDVLVVGRNFGVGSARNIGAVFRGLGIAGSWRSRSTGSACATASMSACRRFPVRAHSTCSKRATWPRSTGPRVRFAMPPGMPSSRAPPFRLQLQRLVAAGGVEDVLRAEGYLAPVRRY